MYGNPVPVKSWNVYLLDRHETQGQRWLTGAKLPIPEPLEMCAPRREFNLLLMVQSPDTFGTIQVVRHKVWHTYRVFDMFVMLLKQQTIGKTIHNDGMAEASRMLRPCS